jgi:uncharacterized protein YeaO (DUF488 family)
MQIWKKSIDQEPGKQDGVRVMVDRSWPKEIPRSQARVDVWLKGLAPSRELRRWYQGEPEKWERFKRNYFRELDYQVDDIDRLADLARDRRVTLVYNERRGNGCHAAALKDYLQEKLDL